MSYEIIYNHVTVKVDNNKYMIFIQEGSNNCAEINPFTGKLRGERHWCPLSVDGKDVFSKKELDFAVDCFTVQFENNEEDSCLYKSKNRVWKNSELNKWIKGGFKRIQTIEDIVNNCNTVIMAKELNELDEHGYRKCSDRFFPRTSLDFFDYLEDAMYDDNVNHVFVDFGYNFKKAPRNNNGNRRMLIS